MRAADELVGLPAPYPGPYADAFLGMLRARAVVSASALGVWRALPGTVEELAQRTGTHPERLAVLLRALRALGYVHCRRGAWRASRRTRRFFGPAARTPLDATVGVLAASNWRVLAGLDDVIRGGSPPGLHGDEPDPATWVGYQASMVELNALVAAPVLDALGTPRRLLDIGGGPGAFALAACVRWPGVDVVVAELPQAASLGRERVRTAGRADRIRYIAGDAATAELGRGCSLARIGAASAARRRLPVPTSQKRQPGACGTAIQIRHTPDGFWPRPRVPHGG